MYNFAAIRRSEQIGASVPGLCGDFRDLLAHKDGIQAAWHTFRGMVEAWLTQSFSHQLS
jgi:hypothetical protein